MIVKHLEVINITRYSHMHLKRETQYTALTTQLTSHEHSLKMYTLFKFLYAGTYGLFSIRVNGKTNHELRVRKFQIILEGPYGFYSPLLLVHQECLLCPCPLSDVPL